MTDTFLTLTQIEARNWRREDEGDPETTRPVVINRTHIRSMTARRQGPGTRITFADGGGFAVAESLADVTRYVAEGIAPPARAPLALVPGPDAIQ